MKESDFKNGRLINNNYHSRRKKSELRKPGNDHSGSKPSKINSNYSVTSKSNPSLSASSSVGVKAKIARERAKFHQEVKMIPKIICSQILNCEPDFDNKMFVVSQNSWSIENIQVVSALGP